MKRTTNLTGALSSASNSIPVVDLPNAATTSSSRSDEQCGIAIPNPIPVLIVSSAESKLANDMLISPREIMLQVLFLISVALYFTGEAKLSGSDLDDKRDLPYVASDRSEEHTSELQSHSFISY